MFWTNKLLQQQVITLEQQVDRFEQDITKLEKENIQVKEANIKLKEESDSLKKQVIQYQAICRKETPIVNEVFKPANSSQEAIKQFEADFSGDFILFIDVDLEVLNVFLHKISLLKCGQYKPSEQAIATCDNFFDFKKKLVKREYLVMLYALLDIEVTSRRFESFDMEIDRDELINMIETLFSYFKYR